MAKHGADETRLVSLNDGSSRVWTAERWGDRYLFIGPRPGTTIFHSVKARSWDEASNDARLRWEQADATRRDKWYGHAGKYTTQRNV